MNANITSTAKMRLIRGAFYLLLLLTGTILVYIRPEASAKASNRTLTFAERVSYQRAIEEVYWRHRIWPKERLDRKPSLHTMMSQGQLEKKVMDYLRDSQAFEDYSQRPITAEQLQAEMDRMAHHTKQPEVLRELFEALGNDPFVVAECLVRPILAQRLLRSSIDPQNANGVMGQPVSFVKTNASRSGDYGLPIIATTLKPQGACNDDWGATSIVNAPTARQFHTAVWTGSEMIVWGGLAGGYSNSGGRYNPATDNWTPTGITDAPAGRSRHTAVWTGSEMIVWGGIGDGGNVLNTGGRYNPVTDSWTATSTTNAPAAREFHVAVWSGSEMIVWGGWATNPLDTGGKYNPSTDRWTATSAANTPAARYYHTGVWTGSDMIIWGGQDFSGAFNTGGKYNPDTDSWTATSTINAPSARIDYTAVWTGSEMVVWGGFSGSGVVNTGGRYNPATDTWTATNLANAPTGREAHTAVLTGNEMIIWGGYIGFGSDTNTGGRYDLEANRWTSTTTINAPSPRHEHKAVWSGSEMIVWGGLVNSAYVNTGGKYCGQYPSPTPTSTPTPTARPTLTPFGVYEMWVARYNGPANSFDRPVAIAVDNTGNVYVTGESDGGSGRLYDYATIKYNAAGEQEWLTRYNGPDNDNDYPSAMVIDGSGNIYVTGVSSNHCASSDFATIKYNSAGQEEWVARRDGGGQAIAVDASGNVYVTGVDPLGWVTIKYNSSGAEEWVAHNDSGGPAAIAVDTGGNVYVTGSVPRAGYVDYATIKYDASGVQQWLAQYEGPGEGTDQAKAIALDHSGNVYVTGNSFAFGTGDDYATIKYDPSGQQQWVARYDRANGADEAEAIAIDASDNVYVTGSSAGPGARNCATVKYNSAGQQQWVALYDGPNHNDYAFAIALDSFQNVYITGSSSEFFLDFLTIKYDSAGQEQWVERYDGPSGGSDIATAIAVDATGKVYITGYSGGIGTSDDYTTIKYGQGPTPTPTPSATASPTPTSTSTPTATPTSSPTPTATCTPVATATPQPTPTPTATSPPPSPTSTPMGTPSATPTSTPTMTPSPTPEATSTATANSTVTITPTATPSATATSTPSVRPTPTARPNITPRTRPTPQPRP